MIKIELNHRFKGFIELIRPFTLLAPIIVSICIMMASCYYNKMTDDLISSFCNMVIPASITLAIVNAASNALNQYTDVNTDKISKPYRPIPRGIISKNEALIASIFFYILAIILSTFVNIMFSVFVLFIIGFSVTYSVPPRIKDILFLNQLWVGVPRGLLGILASWSVFGNALAPLPMTVGLIAMSFLIGGSITKDIIDSEADKINGSKTLVNTYGTKKAALIALPFMFFPFVYIPILIDIGVLDSYLWLLTFLAIPGFLIFRLMVKNEKKVRYLENTPSWTLMYITYFIFAFSFSFLTIFGSFGI